MDVRLLALCCVLHAVDAEPSDALAHSNAEVETVSVIATCADGKGEYFKSDTRAIRNPRQSREAVTKPNVTTVQHANTETRKSKVALVKKPIPKFIDNGSDEDYQAKMKFPNKGSESAEHEDEDFSVDDYDFDVNHDEFAGRGKPLEPRVKVKVSKLRKPAPARAEPPPPSRPAPTLSQSKDMMPHSDSKPTIKVVRKAATGVMKEEEYDEEFSAVTKSSEKPRKISTVKDISLFSEESEDSREDEIKPMRIARSSVPFSIGSYVNKFEEQSSNLVTKMLSYLPLFPNRFLSQDKVNENVVYENPSVENA